MLLIPVRDKKTVVPETHISANIALCGKMPPHDYT
jgi:hypothetical protein